MRQQLLVLAVGLLLPRLTASASARVRVISFVELSARACEREGTTYCAGRDDLLCPAHTRLPCGKPTEHPPHKTCRCSPFKPSYLEFRATIADSTMPSAKYRSPTDYQSVQLDPTKNASCTVVASTWNGTDESGSAPVVVETTLVLKANLDYSLLLVGYLDRASYRPDSGLVLPGKFGELYAVLLVDTAPPPRSHMGTMRLINVSPATSLLLGRISDNGRKLTDFNRDGSAYVCRRPDECKDTNHRGCVPVAFDQAYPPGPPPAPATCDPKHRDEKTGKYEGCPAFDPRTKRAYSCRDLVVAESCQRNPPCDPYRPAGTIGCWPDWKAGNHTTPLINQSSVCQRCKCQYRRIVDEMTGRLSTNDSYCQMFPGTAGQPGHPTECPGKPTMRHGSITDPCPGPNGHKSTATCWREEDPDFPPEPGYPGEAQGLPCEDCITDHRDWSDKCYACPCPVGSAPPPPAPCGPWANPTMTYKHPRQEKAYLISQKKWDGKTQTPTFAIGVEEVPYVDVPAGVHTVELLDGALPYPIHNQLRANVNVPVGKSVTVFLHGLPPSKPDYPNGHPASPLGLDIATDDSVSTFGQVKFASTVYGLTVTVGANQTVGSATSRLRLRLGDTGARTEVDIEPGSVELLRLEVPTYAPNRRGEWGSYAHYEIGWRSGSTGSMHAVPLDTSRSSGSVYVVLSGDRADPKLTTYVNPSLPSAGQLSGMAAVRVINAAYGVDSLDLQATQAHSAAVSVASSIAFGASSDDYTKVPAGTYELKASGGDGLTGVLARAFLYEGLVYTVVVGSDSRELKLVLSLDRSYNSQATVRVRCAYLGGEPERNTDGTAPPARITWSAGGTDGAPMQAPVSVAQGEVSAYTSLALPGTYDDHYKAFRVFLRLSVLWLDTYGSPTKEVECFTQLLPLDMEAHNNTAWTFVVWGSDNGGTCHVITDFGHSLDPLTLPDPSKAGLRVVAGGTRPPSFRAATVQGTDAIVVQSQTSNLGSGYTPVPASINRITLAGSTDPIAFNGPVVVGSLYSLFVRYGTTDSSQLSSSTFADDNFYGSFYTFKLRFLNALSSGPSVALTLEHGEQNLQLGTPVVGSPLLAEAMHRTKLVSASCFTIPGAWVQAWVGSRVGRMQLSLGTKPAETIKPDTCPPHCPLAEGTPVATAPTKPQTVILGNDTTSSAPLFLVAVEDDVVAPKLCNARVRLISLLSSSISATVKLGDTEHQLNSPGLSPTPQNRDPATELAAGRRTFIITGGSPSSNCEPMLHSGSCYSLYVTSTNVDAGGLPIYTCRAEVDRDYDEVGYVRLAHAAGGRDSYSMTLRYTGESAAASCAAVKNLPTTATVRFGEQSGYAPVRIYGTTTYHVTVQQSGSAASTTSHDIDLTAGSNWTIYVLPPRATSSVELWAVADGATAPWSGGNDEVGLRVLDGLPDGSASQWSWKYCDEGEDGCVQGAGTLAPVGDGPVQYQKAAIHGYSEWLPPKRQWRLGLQVARGTERITQEFGSGYQPIMSCDDGTTVVPLKSGGLYTAVLTKAGDTHSAKALLMFQDRDGEPHSWSSEYGLLVALLLFMGVMTLAFLAWCGSKWTSTSKWTLKLDKCLAWCGGRLCGRDGASRERSEADEPLMDGDFVRGDE